MKILVLRGAYGRSANRKDWEDGKDFQIVGGPYCSIRDVELMREKKIETLVFVPHEKNGQPFSIQLIA